MKRAIQGTLEYMAPEVLLKKPASAASDVYALAIALNELATGRREGVSGSGVAVGWVGCVSSSPTRAVWQCGSAWV